MQNPLLPVFLAGSMVAVADHTPSQDNMGLLHNVGRTFACRGEPVPRWGGPGWAAAARPSVQFTRIDKEAYAGWGHDPAHPTMRSFVGLHYAIQDFDGATAESFSLVGYTEDAANANLPDLTNPLFTTGPITTPVTTRGRVSFDVTASFATPVRAPAAADVFVGLSQRGVVNWLGTDGLTVWLTTAQPKPPVSIPGWNVRDLPGPAPVTGYDSYAGYHVPSYPFLGYVRAGQWHIEPILMSAAGVGTALHHGDTLHPAANQPPGTACMLSSLSPDARSPSRNPGRADDIGMTFRKKGIADGTLVFWFAEIATAFPAEVPLSSLFPGSRGALCIDLSAAIHLGTTSTRNGRASNVVAIPAAVRANIANLSVIQQGFAFDTSIGAFRAGPCQMSRL